MMTGARLALLLSLVLTACPGQKLEKPVTTCSKAGQSCEYAPGKLGLCVEPVNGGALICQSQH